MKRNKKSFQPLTLIVGGLLGIFLAIILILCLYPIKIDTLVSSPQVAKSYNESLERIEDLQKTDPPDVDPSARTIVMSHGKKVDQVIVIFHGLTNSPRQFEALGKKFFELGYNVYIPRIPWHGLDKSRASDLEKLTAEDLAAASDDAVDIAQGLGAHVTVAGLSMGGVMAAWVAQERSDVDKAVLIAPCFGTYKIPEFLLKPSINFFIMKPSFFIWWDSKMKENLPRPEAVYYGFSSRAMGEIRRLGWYVQTLGKKLEPKAPVILVVTNANDRAVSKERITAVMRNWQRHDAAHIEMYEFPKDLHLGHDLIDPQQPDQNISAVYPKLISLITGKGNL